MTPNRVAVYVGLVAGIVGAVAPVAANMDWSSTAGVVAGLATIAVVLDRYLKGWQHYENRVAVRYPEDRPAGVVKRHHRLPPRSERPE